MSATHDGKDSDPERVSSHDDGAHHPSKNTVGEGVIHEESAIRRGLQMPAILAAMTPEQRAEAEVRLRRRIDRRLMPMVIVMYILNYIDRYDTALPPATIAK